MDRLLFGLNESKLLANDRTLSIYLESLNFNCCNKSCVVLIKSLLTSGDGELCSCLTVFGGGLVFLTTGAKVTFEKKKQKV